MIDPRTLPDAIQWHEGMLLAPQHFQQLSLRQESLLHYHSMVQSPFFWGVRAVEFDRGLLANGMLRVLALEAIMPDGLLVALMENEAYTLELDVSRHADQMTNSTLTVHLAVPARMASGSAAERETARYDSLPGPDVADEHAADGIVQIPRLRPRAHLLPGDIPPSKFVTFPLAKISQSNGHYALTDYIPPILSVTLQSPAGEICARVAGLLREKGVYLSEEMRSNRYHLGEGAVQESRAKIRSLVEALPYLEGVLHTGVSHPYSLYLALCHVAGHVASLAGNPVPPLIPKYDHNNIRLALGALEEYITRAIEEGVQQAYSVHRFDLAEQVFALRINPEWLHAPLLVGVRGKAKVAEPRVVSWMDEALIGSDAVVGSLRERRILGARRVRVDAAARPVAGAGLVLFEIANAPEFITPGEILQIAGSGGTDTFIEEVLLFIVMEN